jgi:uncharacterized protein YjfI (DUF2170 family)
MTEQANTNVTKWGVGLDVLINQFTTLGYQPVAKGDTLALTMSEYGDLPVILAVGDKQIIAEVVLCPVSQVKDEAATDDAFMRFQKKIPLSSIGKTSISNVDHYVIFGALAATSLFENIVVEVVTLAANALELAELIETEL